MAAVAGGRATGVQVGATSSSAQLVRLDLTGDVAGVGQARALVRRTLLDWQLDHLVDNACLLVSELTTNAVLHARTSFAVTVQHTGERVRVTVHDSAAGAPVRRRNGLHAATGRGLGLIETLAADWGTAPSDLGYGKGVWFELATDDSGTEALGEGAVYGEDWLALVDDL